MPPPHVLYRPGRCPPPGIGRLQDTQYKRLFIKDSKRLNSKVCKKRGLAQLTVVMQMHAGHKGPGGIKALRSGVGKVTPAHPQINLCLVDILRKKRNR